MSLFEPIKLLLNPLSPWLLAPVPQVSDSRGGAIRWLLPPWADKGAEQASRRAAGNGSTAFKPGQHYIRGWSVVTLVEGGSTSSGGVGLLHPVALAPLPPLQQHGAQQKYGAGVYASGNYGAQSSQAGSAVLVLDGGDSCVKALCFPPLPTSKRGGKSKRSRHTAASDSDWDTQSSASPDPCRSLSPPRVSAFSGGKARRRANTSGVLSPQMEAPWQPNRRTRSTLQSGSRLRLSKNRGSESASRVPISGVSGGEDGARQGYLDETAPSWMHSSSPGRAALERELMGWVSPPQAPSVSVVTLTGPQCPQQWRHVRESRDQWPDGMPTEQGGDGGEKAPKGTPLSPFTRASVFGRLP